MISGYHLEVAEHYESYPYPDYPLFASGSWRQLGSVDTSTWGVDHRVEDIWLAGCGTIAPLMFGRRNPGAKILASDLSETTLRICRKRLFLYGIRNVQLVKEDVFQAPYTQAFDAVDAYGVIHHTVSPEKTLAQLAKSLRPGGVLRLMVYSEKHREKIEEMRQLVRKLGLESIEDVKAFMWKNKIERKGDLRSDHGIADALMHPLVHTYNRETLSKLLANCQELKTLRVDDASNFVAFLQKVV